jgi:hypothetical protein
MTVSVQCRVDAQGFTEPVRFQLDQQEYLVTALLDRWYGTDCTFYKVGTNDRDRYILRQCSTPSGEEWTLAAFRRDPANGADQLP